MISSRIDGIHHACYRNLCHSSTVAQRRDDIQVLLELPLGTLNIMDMLVVHPSQQAIVTQASISAGHAGAHSERSKASELRRLGEHAGQHSFMSFM
jgi:hypothetical protein